MDLLLGAGRIDRVVHEAEGLLCDYRSDSGYAYLNYVPVTPTDRIIPEDLGVTLLVNSQASWRACQSVIQMGRSIGLDRLPEKTLEETTDGERQAVAALIAEVASWPGFAASLATKVLHKKRSSLVPILDNQAIFGSYMNSSWPRLRASQDSVKDTSRIKEALDWIAHDLTRAENQRAWCQLATMEPVRSRIELFDSVWWMEFRRLQPVR